MMDPRLYWGSLMVDDKSSRIDLDQHAKAPQKPKRHTPKTQPSSNVVSFADYAKRKVNSQ